LARKKFTTDEVQQMEDAGLFAGQSYELIDGELIDKMGQNRTHARAIRSCEGLIRNQAPIEAGPADSKWNIPKPDLAVLREYRLDFKSQNPQGNKLILAVEVSDTTLEHDAWTKLDLYARAGVPEYWILDLTYPRLLVFSELSTEKGEYASLKGYTADDSVTFASKTIPVAALLPKS